MVSSGKSKYLVFYLDENSYAISLFSVVRIVRSVEITPLPKAPDIILGLINLKGQILPVINVRKRFDYPIKEIELSDKLIILQTSDLNCAFLVTGVEGILEVSDEDVVAPGEIFCGMEYVQGVIRQEKGIIIIHQLDKILSGQEETLLKKVINEPFEKMFKS
ncbi:MAG: chemotaxis protein CheW [Spirochaetaceae bacterium]